MTRNQAIRQLENICQQKADMEKMMAKRRRIIQRAHDEGGLSHEEIAKIVGVTRQQVIRIVVGVRQEMEQV